jgi:hypothetical protein
MYGDGNPGGDGGDGGTLGGDGGQGDLTYGGLGGSHWGPPYVPPYHGDPGLEWDSVIGSGGGGAGQNMNGTGDGYGGKYGGAGGGGWTSGGGGAGTQGLIVITYVSGKAPLPPFFLP